MATVIFEAAGKALGNWIGSSVFQGAFQGAFAAAGSALGSYLGNRVDQSLFGQNFTQEGPRLAQAKITTSTEGTPIVRMWGRQRVAGQMIWATRFLETTTTETQGGKGGGGPETEIKTFSYSCSYAIGLVEGVASGHGRIWADGMLLDQEKHTFRFYKGTEEQEKDPLIVAKEGDAPAYRGLCYIVFENMKLADFGNRIPQITVEVFKPSAATSPDQLENAVQAVTLIPATGEFAYGVEKYVKTLKGATGAENVHNGAGVADLLKSLDNLEAGLPNCETVAVVSSWFGDDLRCGNCTIRPKVETTQQKLVKPRDWRVSGLTRFNAQAVSLIDVNPDPLVTENRPAFGGTPSDDTIYACILELASRGKQVVFYPFLIMDVPPGNTKPNPYSDNAATAGQPAFPWRGRITCSPAAGFVGTVDKTATAATQVAAFFGACDAGDFVWNATTRTVDYSGPGGEWSYRRLLLHYAELCRAANAATPGAVAAFVLGSELVNLTTVRSGASTYPTVAELIDLAGECRTILGAGVKIGYAADWSEYHSHRPVDGSNDVFFHLDPLWSSANIDFVGIDNYMPLADWRDGGTHLDAALGGPYDRGYLQDNIEGGEFYDWFYVDQAARDAQTRTNITDGAYSKPWVFRNKDVRNWWLNAHHDRPGGTESVSPTAWAAQSKPVWFTEFGCPAVDKGANEPNVFVDPKSSESDKPHFSNGARDDLAQRRFIEALLDYWAPASGNNPTSAVYSQPMIDVSRCFVWAWDARPYPEFPQRADIWGDHENWRLGHWISGRVGVAPLASIVREVCGYVGFTDADLNLDDLLAFEALVVGFLTRDLSSPRALLAPLMDAFLFDGIESEGLLKFIRRGGDPALTIDAGAITIDEEGRRQISLTRGQDPELPRSVTLGFIDEDKAYEQAAVSERRLIGFSTAAATFEVPIVLPQTYARALVRSKLYETWIGRESGDIELPPSLMRIEAGDVITVPKNARAYEVRVGAVDAAVARRLAITQTDGTVYTAPELAGRPSTGDTATFYGPPEIRFMDLPMLADDVTPHQPYVAAFATPWPGSVNVYREIGATFALNTNVPSPAVLGETVDALFSGAVGRFDDGNFIKLLVYGAAELVSVTEELLFSGANTIAIENGDGEWEVLQFETATLTSPGEYEIRRLLRGQLGTEGAMRDPVAAGARWCLLDRAKLRQLAIAVEDRGNPITFRYGPATAFHDASSYTEIDETFAAAGLRPYSPTDVQVRRDNSGDWHITWIRRTRVGGDDWEAVEVPLTAPDLEQYELEVLSGGGAVLRTVTGLAIAAFEYTAAMMIADFGAPVFNFGARIYQMSSTLGRGAPWEGLVFPTVFDD